MKAKKNNISGSVKLDPEVYIRARKLCKEQGWVLQTFINNAVKDKVQEKNFHLNNSIN